MIDPDSTYKAEIERTLLAAQYVYFTPKGFDIVMRMSDGSNITVKVTDSGTTLEGQPVAPSTVKDLAKKEKISFLGSGRDLLQRLDSEHTLVSLEKVKLITLVPNEPRAC